MGGLRIAALVAFLFGAFVGTWGLVTSGGTEFTEAAMREGQMWVSIAILALALGSILNWVASRRPG